MKRSSDITPKQPRRSSRTRTPNKFFNDPMKWEMPEIVIKPPDIVPIQPPAPVQVQAPRPTPLLPQPLSIDEREIIVPPTDARTSTQKKPYVPSFVLSRKSGNTMREVITITDEDPIFSMDEDTLRTRLLCSLCMSVPRSEVFIPCGHYIACADCSTIVMKSSRCPMCKTDISQLVTTQLT
jgi:hypothetical protein